jgi:hypothetical protein
MAKRKKQPVPVEPILQPGVPLPLNCPGIPDSWMPVDDFSSHRPMLYRAIMNTHHNGFFEFGTGFGSTPLLSELYATQEFRMNDFISYESDYQWFEIMRTKEYDSLGHTEYAYGHWNHTLFYEPNYMQVNVWKGSLVFIDCAPGELRKHLISKHSNIAKLIIVHDTEPGAEYVYGMQDILNSFNYRCDLIVEGGPRTTVVSNLYEFNNWKTYINEKIRFE